MSDNDTKMTEPMSKEEMIDILKGLVFGSFDRTTAKEREALDMVIEALEQESMLDKIRDEIADIYCGQYCENPLTAYGVKEMVLEIIDKYTESSEDKE